MFEHSVRVSKLISSKIGATVLCLHTDIDLMLAPRQTKLQQKDTHELQSSKHWGVYFSQLIRARGDDR